MVKNLSADSTIPNRPRALTERPVGTVVTALSSSAENLIARATRKVTRNFKNASPAHLHLRTLRCHVVIRAVPSPCVHLLFHGPPRDQRAPIRAVTPEEFMRLADKV